MFSFDCLCPNQPPGQCNKTEAMHSAVCGAAWCVILATWSSENMTPLFRAHDDDVPEVCVTDQTRLPRSLSAAVQDKYMI